MAGVYAKTTWVGPSGVPGYTPFTSQRMNNMEAGIAAAIGAAAMRREQLSGGGTITFDANNNFLWTNTLHVGIGAGMWTDQQPLPSAYQNAAYGDITINPPATGAAFTGHGGVANGVTSANGFPMPQWGALYFNPADGSFHIVGAGAFDVPLWWVCLCVVGSPTTPSFCRVMTGHTLQAGLHRVVSGMLQGIPFALGTNGSTFSNTWRLATDLAAYAQGAFELGPDGWVRLSGLIDKPTGGTWNVETMFTLPVGYRPSIVHVYGCLLAGNNVRNFGSFDIDANGVATLRVGAAANPVNWLSLEGISFKAGA